ncbi:solute carrier family 23 protein [uncultured Georgenia sp.]|uniref:solute carrier family 23 protein n=1 Tax=uncultured Georgenia sp. TaxID=378209 RepID=UPI00262C7592|nr:solute carrier family 23 protein [uncultured Georgenia sp.]
MPSSPASSAPCRGTSYSQNAGLVPLTGILSRHVATATGAILVLLSLFPKGAAAITAMPSAVLGGAAILLFGNVLAIGIKLLGETGLDQRLLIVVAVSLTVGQGLGLVPEAIAVLPDQLVTLLGTGVVPAVVVGIVLNLVLRERTEDRPEQREPARPTP